MFGKNPKRPAINSDGKTLDVQEIFPTIQGEGPYTGQSAVFIRLGGCNLACEFCDTEFESFKAKKTDDVVARAIELATSTSGKRVIKLAVITGGEPLRQPIEYLCEQLIKNGFKVQIETNGTLYRPLAKEVEIVCSPKNTGKGYAAIRPDLLERINAFKFIISANNSSYRNVAEVGQASLNVPVYIQPMDEYNEQKNKNNLELVKKLAMENGYIISLQTHKIIGVA
jgi:7-carboxy-7-deazaguanine synthase